MSELFRAFQEFCNEPRNYEKGWDIPAECWDESDLVERVRAANLSWEVLSEMRPETALKLVVKVIRPTVELLQERRREIQSEIF